MKQPGLLKLRELPEVVQTLTDKVKGKNRFQFNRDIKQSVFNCLRPHATELSTSHPSKLTALSLLCHHLKHLPQEKPHGFKL